MAKTDGGKAMMYGGIAVACLLIVLVGWLASPATASHALFGKGGSVAIVVIGLVATIIGVLATRLTGRSALRRWAVAVPIAVIAGGVTVLAIGGVFAPNDVGDVAFGVLLAAAAVTMDLVAVQVSRS